MEKKYNTKNYRTAIRLNEEKYNKIKILQNKLKHKRINYGNQTTITEVIEQSIDLFYNIIIKKSKIIRIILKNEENIELYIEQKPTDNCNNKK